MHFRPLSRSRPTTPSGSRAPSPPPFDLRGLSASTPNIAAPARYPDHVEPSLTHTPLEIVLASNTVVVRGAGSETEPASLSGTVVLHLLDATPIKEVTLQLRGKSRIRVSPTNHESHARPQHQTTVVFEHEWDFLQGDKSHPHTLKAGRHEFPFSLELDSSIPSSIYANDGGAVLGYKLKAMAVRPSLATNYLATQTVTILRSFTNQALEYQQTLEVENTWPEKVWYRIIIPHKAWAAGDEIAALLKFTPLAKGVKVVNIKMSLQEKVKTVWRSIPREETRIIATKTQALKRGQRPRPSRSISAPTPAPAPTTGVDPLPSDRLSPPSFLRRVTDRVSRENLRSRFRIGGPSGSSTPAQSPPQSPPQSGRNSDASSVHSNDSDPAEGAQSEEEDIEVAVKLPIPVHAPPSHNLAPVIISHRVKWEVLIKNMDGHHSELRCSLPIHLLHGALLEEARSASAITRNLLFGADSQQEPVPENTLPAYSDHVRDRVASADLPHALFASNPLTTDAHLPEDDVPAATVLSTSYGASSTFSSPLAARSTIPRVSSMPDASERGRLSETYPSELALSLGLAPLLTETQPTPPDSQNASRQESRTSSGNSSRASSPEPAVMSDGMEGSSHRTGILSRPRTPGKFNLKPFTPFTSFSSKRNKSTSTLSLSRPSMRHGATPSLPASRSTTPAQELSNPMDSHHPSRSSTAASSLHLPTENIYDTIPDYSVAARGFLGGGITPLSALRGLPSYADVQVERSRSPFSSLDLTSSRPLSSVDNVH